MSATFFESCWSFSLYCLTLSLNFSLSTVGIMALSIGDHFTKSVAAFFHMLRRSVTIVTQLSWFNFFPSSLSSSSRSGFSCFICGSFFITSGTTSEENPLLPTSSTASMVVSTAFLPNWTTDSGMSDSTTLLIADHPTSRILSAADDASDHAADTAEPNKSCTDPSTGSF